MNRHLSGLLMAIIYIGGLTVGYQLGIHHERHYKRTVRAMVELNRRKWENTCRNLGWIVVKDQCEAPEPVLSITPTSIAHSIQMDMHAYVKAVCGVYDDKGEYVPLTMEMLRAVLKP